MRYAPVIDVLKAPGIHSILDVGSGLHGVSRYLKGPHIVQTDLHLDGSRRAPCDLVRADALHLPFGERSFDAVLSLDLIEHLPASDRAKALDEMCRVARDRVVVGFPVLPGAAAADANLAAYLSQKGRPVPPWLSEHQANGYPEADFPGSSPSGWTLADRLDNDPVWLHESLARLEHHRLFGRLSLLPVPLAFVGAVAKARGRNFYRSISVFRRVSVEAPGA